MWAPQPHGALTGPLDAIVELGLPLVALVAFWLYARRGRRSRDEAERRRTAGDPSYYEALATDDLATLVAMLADREERTAEDERILSGARAELGRRGE